jgi:beta-ureidopropionase / N-carbamoyl-L-amino-acid hydrolase
MTKQGEITGGIAKHVSIGRLWERLMALAQFGALKKGGVNRQALCDEEIPARAQLVAWAQTIGLDPANDDAGNLFLRFAGTNPDLPPVMVGSHIDSQPTGGKFDGPLGVLAGLECVEAISASGARPRRSIDIVSWMNEEGSRFAPGMMGSAVFAGARKLHDILGIRDKNGIAVESDLRKILDAEPRVPRRRLGGKPAAFLEMHIEQGTVLESAGKTIGVVTGMQGKRTFRVEVAGEESHAGTSARSIRRDALISAIAIVGALQEAMWDAEDIVRFTVGMFTVTPNAPSVVPGRVTFSIDLRHQNTVTLRELGDAIPAICRKARGRCEVSVKELLYDPPLEFPVAMRDTIKSASTALHVPWMDVLSFAGHDSRYLHAVCPTAMVFIPCKDGISHNEAESIREQDALDGTRVLAEAVFALANVN